MAKKRMRQEERVWLSYDLGVRGDYSALYEWLDAKEARECGDSLATFVSDKSAEELSEELSSLLGGTKARLYLIAPDGSGGRPFGRYISGKRKSAPWAGYFDAAVDAALDQ